MKGLAVFQRMTVSFSFRGMASEKYRKNAHIFLLALLALPCGAPWGDSREQRDQNNQCTRPHRTR